jgi:hypothetical protein
MQASRQPAIIAPLERFLAILGAAACLIVTIMVWLSVSASQNIWPLPGLYFIEMVALSSLGAFTFIRNHPHDKLITWGVAGVLSIFSILGAWSVGLAYAPIALIFVAISVISDVRNKQPILAHLGVFFIAGLVQLVLMLAAIRWLA